MVKAQYKNNPDFGKGACCSYDLLARALVPKEEQQVIMKGAQLSDTWTAVVKHPLVLTVGTALRAAKGLCSYPHVLVAVPSLYAFLSSVFCVVLLPHGNLRSPVASQKRITSTNSFKTSFSFWMFRCAPFFTSIQTSIVFFFNNCNHPEKI